jgi:hypothetical protein
MKLVTDLLACGAAGVIGVGLAHLFYNYTDRRGWRGWDLG